MDSVLWEHPLRQLKAQVKLDKGFEEGTYCVYVEYGDLAADKGFSPARKTASAYGSLLREKLQEFSGYTVGEMEDHSRTGTPHRKRDLESTFLSFPLEYADGRWYDAEMTEHFRVAFLRAGQAWDQEQARVHSRHRNSRQERFRQQLHELLSGEAYKPIDPGTRQRLLEEVTELVFPEKGVEFS